jgi:Restriction endonuclease NaeI
VGSVLRYPLPKSAVEPLHTDFAILYPISEEILRRAGSASKLRDVLGTALRQAIDEIIDTPRTQRCAFKDLAKTEKTYLGTRVEILLRDFLRLPVGKRDLVILGTDVDVKFTSADNWMIPIEARNSICLLVAADEDNELCSLGLIVAREEYLNTGENRDGKLSIRRQHFQHILWLVNGAKYPASFWKSIQPATIKFIFGGSSGTERLARLFSSIKAVPIHRSAIESVARQRDSMKRVRANGGVRDRKGLLILSGKYDRAKIAELGLPACDVHSFISA